MKDVLIPLGLLGFIVLFGYAMVRAGRQQRAAKQRVFEAFASRRGLRYRAEDDGEAQAFAREFDGIGRFRSSSLGQVLPKDVASGTLDGVRAVLFRHSIRYGHGWAREWFVAGVEADQPLAERCAIQFCRRRRQRQTMHLADPVVATGKIGAYELVVRAPVSSAAGRFADDRTLERLAAAAGELPFRPELQVRDRRLIAYLADRNATIDDADTLHALFAFARRAAEA